MKKFILFFPFLLLSLIFPLRAEIAEQEQPVVILGSGVGALTSAIYLARAGIPPVVITGPNIGGTITQSHNVQNWPSEVSISGIELGERVKRQAEENGAILAQEIVISVDLSKRPFTVVTKPLLGPADQIKHYKTESVIIALGATPNLLNIPGETGNNGYWSRGVYSCAVCDGALYKGKSVAIVGGGDAAVIEAQYLSNIAEKVHIFVRRDEFRGMEKERMKEVLARPNVEVHFKTVVKEIKGDGQKATHLLVHDVSNGEDSSVAVDALFLAIGARPNTGLFQGQLDLDAQGYIQLRKHQQTSVEGVYAIGDVCDSEFKQAISAAGDAAKAALQAQKYLASHPSSTKQMLAQSEKKPEARKAIEISSREHFDQELRESKGPVFVDFYALYCGPCRMFGPLYETWAKEYGDKIKFLKVNPENGRELFEKYQVRSIPTLIIFDERGSIVRKVSGLEKISELEKQLVKMNEIPSAQDFK